LYALTGILYVVANEIFARRAFFLTYQQNVNSTCDPYGFLIFYNYPYLRMLLRRTSIAIYIGRSVNHDDSSHWDDQVIAKMLLSR